MTSEVPKPAKLMNLKWTAQATESLKSRKRKAAKGGGGSTVPVQKAGEKAEAWGEVEELEAAAFNGETSRYLAGKRSRGDAGALGSEATAAAAAAAAAAEPPAASAAGSGGSSAGRGGGGSSSLAAAAAAATVQAASPRSRKAPLVLQ